MLLAITQDSDNPEWDHRSLQLLKEEVGPRAADLGRGYTRMSASGPSAEGRPKQKT